jgi:hypothetical protein
MSVPFKIILRLSFAIFLFLLTLALPGIAIAENQDGRKTIVVNDSNAKATLLMLADYALVRKA